MPNLNKMKGAGVAQLEKNERKVLGSLLAVK
jgi:hypothetical protein